MLVLLIIVLGIACVFWTTFELSRLVHAQSSLDSSASRSHARKAAAPNATAARKASACPRYARFAAWDDRGRPIKVEDLGQF